MEESIGDLLGRAIDYWEAVQYDDVPTKDDEEIAIDWLEVNCCPVVYDDGTYKVWEDRTDSGNYVIGTPHGLMWAKRITNDKEEL